MRGRDEWGHAKEGGGEGGCARAAGYRSQPENGEEAGRGGESVDVRCSVRSIAHKPLCAARQRTHMPFCLHAPSALLCQGWAAALARMHMSAHSRRVTGVQSHVMGGLQGSLGRGRRVHWQRDLARTQWATRQGRPPCDPVTIAGCTQLL
jgi:hypothetical protein